MSWVSPVDISKYLYYVKGSGVARIRDDAPDWAKKEYAPYGGEALIGQSLLTHCGFEGRTKVEMVIEWFKENNDKDSLFCYHKDESNTDVYLVAIRNKDRELIGFTGIYESRDPETIEGYVFD